MYIYNIDFWSRTNSNTFICDSEFHASHEAIIRQMTTITVTLQCAEHCLSKRGRHPTVKRNLHRTLRHNIFKCSLKRTLQKSHMLFQKRTIQICNRAQQVHMESKRPENQLRN